MKLIKPLLIYIIWIAFVWLCIAYMTLEFKLVFNEDGTRFALLGFGPIIGFCIVGAYLDLKDR